MLCWQLIITKTSYKQLSTHHPNHKPSGGLNINSLALYKANIEKIYQIEKEKTSTYAEHSHSGILDFNSHHEYINQLPLNWNGHSLILRTSSEENILKKKKR